MKIIVESHIPFIKGRLETAGHNVIYLSPEKFTPETVKDADALIIRTRTRCDARLLDRSRVSVIATATIGTDHIDLDYCRRQGIAVFNAPGCNAPAVAQYVLASISSLGITSGTIGIVGVGHIGSIVDRWARANGFRTLLCDPPLGLDTTLSTLAADADVITFHTPLDVTTRHMADARFFFCCGRKPVIINAARGAVIDTPALVNAIKDGKVGGVVIDCWEGEPKINRELLALADIATPHIAGYSIEGKRRATAMVLRAVDPGIQVELDPVGDAPMMESITGSYDPIADTSDLKSNPTDFEALRNNYVYRSEPR